MTEDEVSRMANHYREMSEIELMDVARAYDGLQEPAQNLLREEFGRRGLEPPLIDEDDPLPTHQTSVTVAKYRDLSEAIVARSVLESAGLDCYLQDENTIRMDWLWSNLLGGLRLQVAERDVGTAQDLLSQPRPESIEFAEEPDFEQPVCPKCNSLEVVLDSGNGRKVASASWLILGIPIPTPSKHTGEQVWHCLSCGCKWIDDEQPDDAPASDSVG
jgi:hypothetical protein